MPPAGRARSETRTSGFRAAPDSASRPRHRSRRTKAPAGTRFASRFGLAVIGQRIVGPNAIAMTTPFDAATAKARDKDDKRQYVAERTHPEQIVAQLEGAIEFDLEHEAAQQRRDRDRDARRHEAAEQHAEQRQRPGVRQRQPGKAKRVHGSDGTGPAQLGAEQTAPGPLP